MLLSDPRTSQQHVGRPTAMPVSEALRELLEQFDAALHRAFGVGFALADGTTGELLLPSTYQPECDWGLQAELCRQVASRRQVEFIGEEDPLIVLAIPAESQHGDCIVAVGVFITRPLASGERLARAAERLGIDRHQIDAWAAGQTPWSAEQLWRVAELAVEQFRSAGQIARLESEVRSLSVNLATTYEEISLLHRLANNLKISQSDEQLGRIAVEWLGEVLPAAGFALQFLPVGRADVNLDHQARSTAVLLTHGQCPLDHEQFDALIAHVKPASHGRPTVLNRSVTGHPGWPFPQVRQAILVALVEGENLFGWLAAVNHREDREFGTVEASLLGSVAAILGIHSGNIELYRQQSELLAGIVRALTSAIDAKDPYTCGHSDRVARIAVRLAEELGGDAKMLNAIYLAGLLHDIGKIGIDDSVLRKPGRLSDEEYAHIKRHVEIGHRILRDLHKLEDVLPVVLHHHESWDGDGYPKKLRFHEIPLAARIVAVADSYDAMSSDRPYRAGMPEEKIDAIFRAGAGKQWDPEVVAAFFRARDDIRAIARGQ